MSGSSRRALVEGVYGSAPEACAPRIEALVEALFVDAAGLVRGAISGRTLRPYTQRQMGHVPLTQTYCWRGAFPLKYKPVALNYEETGMAQGDYLLAMCHKHRATGEDRARRIADRTYGAIRELAETIGASHPYGWGWWPKPFGGMKDLNEQSETSIDQCTKVMLGLELYESTLARRGDARWCRRFAIAMADWWIEHGYATNYFGNTAYWDLMPAPHAIGGLLYMVQLARSYAGGSRRAGYDEALTYLGQHRAHFFAPRGALNACNLAIETLCRLEALAPSQRRYWARARRAVAQRQFRLTNMRDGTNVIQGHGRYNTGVRTACSAAALLEHTGRREYDRRCTKLLRIYNRAERFHHHDQSHPPTRPNRVNWWFDALSGHAHTAWLHAYWRQHRHRLR